MKEFHGAVHRRPLSASALWEKANDEATNPTTRRGPDRPSFPSGFLRLEHDIAPVWWLELTRVPIGSVVWRLTVDGGQPFGDAAYRGLARGWEGSRGYLPPTGLFGPRARWRGGEFIAAFTADPLTVLPGSTVSFQDLSLNAPTQWTWAFEGGDVTSSTAQNPQVSYSTVGYYDVQLIVANAHGSDTLLIPDFIRVVNSFNLCEVSNTGAFTGTFYDPEGETADYLSNEFCTLLIAPPCASSITVSFDAFRTESGYDFLNFYDGADALAPSLGQFSGSTIPASFTTTGGQLFVAWTSDQSVTDDGFAVNWTAQIGSQEDLTTIAAADDMNPAYGQSVQFSDNSLETPSAWNWDFGDGTSSVLQNPVHTYLTSGAKTVVLTASNCASTDQDTLYLQVQVPGTIATTPDTLFLTGTLCEDSLYGSFTLHNTCLLYTSDAADARSSVDLGGRRIIKKQNKKKRDDRETQEDTSRWRTMSDSADSNTMLE